MPCSLVELMDGCSDGSLLGHLKVTYHLTRSPHAQLVLIVGRCEAGTLFQLSPLDEHCCADNAGLCWCSRNRGW